jgi:hypothetical protein
MHERADALTRRWRRQDDELGFGVGIVCLGGLDHYFEQVLGLTEAGNLSEQTLRELRLRYDTEEPDQAPEGHWSQG